MEKRKVLICDDDPDLLMMVSLVLESENFDVVTLRHMEGVVEKVINEKPDVILMDLWMPDINGEEAIILLRGNSETDKVPVILFSASTKANEVAASLGVSFLGKPFAIEELVGKIFQVVK